MKKSIEGGNHMNRYNIFGAVFFAAVYIGYLVAYALDYRDDERERKEDE